MQQGDPSAPFTFANLTDGMQAHDTTIIFGAVIIFVWGFFSVGSMRDDEGLRLPRSFAPKLFYALSQSMVYLLLVIFGFLSPGLLTKLPLPSVVEIPEGLLRNVPLVALLAMGALMQLPQVREFNQRFANILHNAQYRRGDEQALRQHLSACGYEPSLGEVEQNIRFLREFDVYVTDRSSNLLQLEAVDSWRKVSCLLRHLSEHAEGDRCLLSVRDRGELQRLKDAHRRKTELAMNIIRLLDQMAEQGGGEQQLTRVASMLTDAPHRDRDRVTEAETAASQIVTRITTEQTEGAPRPLRLSSRQLGQYLSQIQRYFLAEYRLLLDETTKLTSKVVLRAGDESHDRLEEIKAMGFQGLGTVEQVNFDRVIWVLMTVWLVVFGGFAMASILSGREITRPDVLVSIAVTASIAALIGAMWGSRRSLIEARVTPWSSYVAAGLISVGVFAFVQSVRFLLDPAGNLAFIARRAPEAANYELWQWLPHLMPFAVSVFVLTVAICRLARLESWSPVKALGAHNERVLDGVVIGLVYMLGGVAAMTLHYAFGTHYQGMMQRLITGEVGPGGQSAMAGFIVTLVRNFVVGFLIGFLVVRDVRRIGHNHVIDTPAQAARGVRVVAPAETRAAPTLAS